MSGLPDSWDRWRTRFGGYARETLDGFVADGSAVYDEARHVWIVQGSDGPFDVTDVDAPPTGTPWLAMTPQDFTTDQLPAIQTALFQPDSQGRIYPDLFDSLDDDAKSGGA